MGKSFLSISRLLKHKIIGWKKHNQNLFINKTGILTADKIAFLMKKITLTQGQFAIVDDADFDFLAAYKWQAHRRSEKYTYYAMRTVYNPKRTIYMHKAIAEKYGIKGQLLGHVDKNGLNNQKDNLIFATASNVRQYRRKLGKSSLPIGVRQRKNGKYDSRIQVGNKSVYLGLYASMDEAAEKYKLASRFYFGDFAPTQ